MALCDAHHFTISGTHYTLLLFSSILTHYPADLPTKILTISTINYKHHKLIHIISSNGMGNVSSSSTEDIIKSGDRYKIARHLFYAAQNGKTESVKMLLEAKVNVHYQDDLPLRTALMHGHVETVKILLEHKANVAVRNQWCIRHASAQMNHAMVMLLLEHKADISRIYHAYFRCFMSPRGWTGIKQLERMYDISRMPEYYEYQRVKQQAVIEITRVYGRILGLIIFDYI